jgi:hypothetical protein
MNATRAISESPALEGATEASVIAVLGPRTVRLDADGEVFDATVATTGEYRPSEGDRVLALRRGERAWVFGVIGALRAVPAPVRTSDGVEARVSDGVLTVRDARGQVLFEHDARTGKSAVHARELELRAEGELALEAGRGVRIRGETIALETSESTIAVGKREVEVKAPSLRATLDESRVSIQDAFFAAARVESAFEKARTIVGVAEVRAGRILEQARDVFREVEGVSQTRAGRIRTVAKTAYSLLANRATIKAEDDLHFLGEKIHLA